MENISNLPAPIKIDDPTARMVVRPVFDASRVAVAGVVVASGSKGEGYTLRFTTPDASDATCECLGYQNGFNGVDKHACKHIRALQNRLAGREVKPARSRASRKPAAKRVSARRVAASNPTYDAARDESDARVWALSRIAAPAGVVPAIVPPVKPDAGAVAARIKEYRVNAGWTQADLAKATGMRRCNVSRIESGKFAPTLTTLTRIADAFRVSVSLFI